MKLHFFFTIKLDPPNELLYARSTLSQSHLRQALGAKAFGALQGRPDSPERPMPGAWRCHARLPRLIRCDQCNPHELFNLPLPTGVVLPHIYFYTGYTGLTSPFCILCSFPIHCDFGKKLILIMFFVKFFL